MSWMVHSKEGMIVEAHPESNFPISIELTFGTADRTPARVEKGQGAWFGVDDAALLIADLQKAIETVINASGEYYFYGRTIKITDMKNGRFVYETDRDESGYVTAPNCSDAVIKINNLIRRAIERQIEEEDAIAESLDSGNG
jgi:hypothetical protein